MDGVLRALYRVASGASLLVFEAVLPILDRRPVSEVY